MMTLQELRVQQRDERAKLVLKAAKLANTTRGAGALIGVSPNVFSVHLKELTGKTFNQVKGRTL